LFLNYNSGKVTFREVKIFKAFRKFNNLQFRKVVKHYLKITIIKFNFTNTKLNCKITYLRVGLDQSGIHGL